MKKLFNTLFVTQDGSYLQKERETVVVKIKAEKIAQFPLLSIQDIFCFGRVSISPGLMASCTDKSIGISYFTEYGRFIARVIGKQTGNVLLRREQYRVADSKEKSLAISQWIIAAKLANSRSILQREIRNYGTDPLLEQAVIGLLNMIQKVRFTQSLDELFGVEGEGANIYFSVFDKMIKETEFSFTTRVRRPPIDPVNALLSFTYSLLTQECASSLYGVGLDPFVGFLHQDRPGRLSLALDILEEFRSYWADRFVLTLINRKQVRINDFKRYEGGAVRLTDEGRKKFLIAYQERKRDELIHPYFGEKIPLGLLPHCQALLLARHLRGDMQYYTPFVVK